MRCLARGTSSRLQCTGPGATRQMPALCPQSMSRTVSRHGASRPAVFAAALDRGAAGLLPFATAVLAADPDDDFIMMPEKLPCRYLPYFLCESIMVRNCYRDIFNLMLEIDQQAAGTCESGFGMVITGTLGIGKSALALYLICCLAHRHQRVVYRFCDMFGTDKLVLMDFTDHNDIKVDIASEGDSNHRRLREVADEASTWMLIEGKAPPVQYSGGPRMIVMTSSPAKQYREFLKGSGAEQRWLPVWSLAELEKCRAVLYPELHPDTVKERYTQFGGVMRIVLDQRNNYSLENVLQGVSSRSAYRLLSLDVEDDRSVELHYLAHAQVNDEFKFDHYALGSPLILEAVADKAGYTADAAHWFMNDLMQADPDLPLRSGTAKFLGTLHERYVHSLVPGGWHLDHATFRQLKPNADQAPAIKPRRFTAQQLSDALAQGWEHVWDDGQDLAMTEGYFRPRFRKEAGYDGFINSKGFTIILVITRDPDHKVNVKGIVSLLERLPSGKPACVLFALPPHPPELAQQLRYQSWTMEERTDTKNMTYMAWWGQKKEREESERLVVKAEKLPALVKEVEQWCVPFTVIQSSAASSSNR